jgi:drug/metabolite transporter (DMT)-like permease
VAASRLRPILFFLGAMALFVSMDAINKTLTQTYAVPQIMAIRFALFVAMGCLIARQGPWLVLKSKAPWWQALRTAVLLLEMMMFVLSFRYLPLADVHAVAAAAPLIATALAHFFLGEKVDFVGWLLVAGGMVGAVLVVGPAFEHFGPPMWFAVVATLTWGVYQILTRIVGRLDSAHVTTLHTPIVGLAIMAVVASFYWHWPTALEWVLLLIGGALGAGAHILVVRALALAPASELQPYNYFMVVFATVLGAVIYGDIPGLWTWVGAAVVVACGLVAMRRAARRPAA